MEQDARRATVLAITSGKGGVGKTTLSVNLSIVLSQLGAHVLLVDADMGLANVDVLMGLAARATLDQVVSGERTLLDVVCEGPAGISVIPSSSGIGQTDRWLPGDFLPLERELRQVEKGFDFILIDTGAGISSKVTEFATAADDTLVVVTPEPTSIVDAYSMIKIITSARSTSRKVPVIANQVASGHAADGLVRKLDRILDRFLGQHAVMAGYLVSDPVVSQAIFSQTPFVIGAPKSRATACVVQIARRLLGYYPKLAALDHRQSPLKEAVRRFAVPGG